MRKLVSIISTKLSTNGNAVIYSNVRTPNNHTMLAATYRSERRHGFCYPPNL